MKLILDRVLSAGADREVFLARLRAKALEGVTSEQIARAEANHSNLMRQLAPGYVPPWLGAAMRKVAHGNRT